MNIKIEELLFFTHLLIEADKENNVIIIGFKL